MDSFEKYEYWLDIAQYDLDTAEAMLNSGRWLYVVFMCQQAVEKLVKGLYVLYIDDNVPSVLSQTYSNTLFCNYVYKCRRKLGNIYIINNITLHFRYY